MFDRIALVYDPMNTAMTAGLHHRWRERAADEARVGPGDRVLDVATGTGDLALELARRVGPGGEVIGADFSERMLDRAREKAQSTGAGGSPSVSGRPFRAGPPAARLEQNTSRAPGARDLRAARTRCTPTRLVRS